MGWVHNLLVRSLAIGMRSSAIRPVAFLVIVWMLIPIPLRHLVRVLGFFFLLVLTFTSPRHLVRILLLPFSCYPLLLLALPITNQQVIIIIVRAPKFHAELARSPAAFWIRSMSLAYDGKTMVCLSQEAARRWQVSPSGDHTRLELRYFFLTHDSPFLSPHFASCSVLDPNF